MTRLIGVALLAGALALAACGEKEEPAGEPGGRAQPLRLMLDYYPNADHAGLYAAEETGAFARAGLDLTIQRPPDPAGVLRLLQAGKVDLAISYEPDLLLARDKGADLVAVGALVQEPLTSLMWLGKSRLRSVRDLAGKTVGTAGIPYQAAYLTTILRKAGVDPSSVRQPNVGFALDKAMISGKVDATLGAFWNVEGVDLERAGRDPRILRMEQLGVPDYQELIFVARRRDLQGEKANRIRRFMGAVARGHRVLREDPEVGLRGLMAAERGLDAREQRAKIRATLPVFFPADRSKPFGWQDPAAWQRYSEWMAENDLLRRRPEGARALTNEFLPGEGLDPGRISQD